MDAIKHRLIISAALSCLLDNFQYDPADFADLDFSESDIVETIERLGV